MIGIVLVSHGSLANEFGKALEHVVGKQTHLACININPDDDFESRRHDIMQAINDNNSGDGVVLCTDIFGGTPCNLAVSSCMTQNKVELISGLNLPMLIKLATMRETTNDVKEVANQCCEAAKKHINVASKVMA